MYGHDAAVPLNDGLPDGSYVLIFGRDDHGMTDLIVG